MAIGTLLIGALLATLPTPVLAKHHRTKHHRAKHQHANHHHALPNSATTATSFPATAQHMLATAYTASCNRCSGRTALGYQAGHGIVAVDPRVIPLGTRLFIPGYGAAIAGDTGGSIKGRRIDLGFDNYNDARRFGRRDITVYVLH